MALHEQSVGATDEWYTPPEVFEAMGVAFDLDVASPGHNVVPWIPAVERFTCDSLSRAWSGFVWMNPPFGARNGVLPWLNKFFAHGDGVALIPDRTAAPWWQAQSPRADRLLFVAKKLKFLTPSPRLGSRKNKDCARKSARAVDPWQGRREVLRHPAQIKELFRPCPAAPKAPASTSEQRGRPAKPSGSSVTDD
jgi:hypothetical protein